MITSIECIPCLLRQTLDAARMAEVDQEIQASIMRKVLALLSEMDLFQSPPELAQKIHRIIRDTTGVVDPYDEIKHKLNKTAMDLYPELTRMVQTAADPLTMAVRLAIAGNAIDMGVNGQLQTEDVLKIVEGVVEEPFFGNVENFRSALKQAKSILYLADNSGEIVFDRVLIEHISLDRVTLVVRGGPVINDATRVDAQEVGLDKLVEVIDNGSDAPGTILKDCSIEFQNRFHNTDLIISKGQGNFETLNDVPGNVYFLFKTKCALIRDHTQQPVGTQVLLQTQAKLAETISYA